MKKHLFAALLALIMLMGTAARAAGVTLLDANSVSPFRTKDGLLKVYFVNTHGNTDAIVICHAGQTMVVDCGGNRGGSSYVKPLLDELGIENVDYVFSTLPRDDHIGGFVSLFDVITVDKLYTAFPYSYCKEQSEVIKAAMERGIEVANVTADSDISFGDIKITLWQDARYITTAAGNANNASMLMYVRFGVCTLLIPGDAGKEVFLDLYDEIGDAMQTDVLKLPYHGYTSPSYDMLDVLKPGYGIVTNYYSDRISATAQTFHNKGIPLMYTAKGTVELVSDGSRWTIRQLPDA